MNAMIEKLLAFAGQKKPNLRQPSLPRAADYRGRLQPRMAARADMAAYVNALQAANGLVPDRKPLLAVYRRALGDAHLQSAWQQRRLATVGRPYQLLNAEGHTTPVAEAHLALNGLNRFAELALDALLMGPSLIALERTEEGETRLSPVPLEAVEPQTGMLRLPDGEAVLYAQSPWSQWLIPVADPTSLGLMRQAAPLVIWKQQSLTRWSHYLEVFGMPFRKAHTDIRDAGQRERLAHMLEDMGTGGWGVFDQEDRVEFVQAQGQQGGGDGYERMARFCDQQISKLILGQTMTTEAGASLSQAEVHERVFQSIARSDARYIEDLVNRHLLPRLIALGEPLEGLTFRFVPDEDALPPSLKAQLLATLLPYKHVPDEWIEAEFGVKVRERSAE